MDSRSASQRDDEHLQVQIEAASVVESRRLVRHGRRGLPAIDQRLGVGDLLLWVTFVGLYFGVVRARQPEASVGSLGLLLLLTQAAIAGPSWGGLWVVILRTVRGIPLPEAPGHWLLVALGGRLAIEVALGFKPGEVFASPEAVVSAIMCCLLVLPTLDRRLSTPWKALFCLLILVFSLPLLQTCLSVWFGTTLVGPAHVGIVAKWLRITLSPFGPLVLSIYFAFRGTRYRGLHWVGVASWLAWHLIQPVFVNRLL